MTPSSIIPGARPSSVAVLSALLSGPSAALETERRGAILDIGDVTVGELGRIDGTYDTIVSVARLVVAPDLRSVLAAVHDALGSDGRLLFAEPTRRPGLIGGLTRAQTLFATVGAGLYLDRDVPAAIRGAGLTITDLHRETFRAPALLGREYVWGIARRRRHVVI